MKNTTKSLYRLPLLLFAMFFSINGISQKANGVEKADSPGEALTFKWRVSLEDVRIKYGASKEDFATFKRFESSSLEALKERALSEFGEESMDISVLPGIMKKTETDIAVLYKKFLDTKSHYPSSVAEFAHAFNPLPAQTCDPSGCTNIDFNEGTLSGWYGYYAENNSTSSFDITNSVGGVLGAVTEACNDPVTMAFNKNNCGLSSLTTDYQMALTSGGNDYVIPSITRVSPWATGGHSVMMGDSIMVGSGVSILSKTFLVSQNNANFSYEYAVILMDPYHPFHEQPFFAVTLLNAAGDTIPDNVNYNVVSGYGMVGFDSIIYNGSCEGPAKVFYKNWTKVNVSLNNYIGQCVTVIFEVADCSQGGHFGYAYIDASCAPSIVASTPMLCKGASVTLTGPSGGSDYAWAGPLNGITTNNTLQTVTVDSAGTYTLVVTPASGVAYNDTLYYSLDTDYVTATVDVDNIVCNGGTGSATVNVVNGNPPFTYYWSPSGESNATATGLSAGTYSVTVVDACGKSDFKIAVITQTDLLSATATASANEKCNGENIGNATVSVSGGTSPYTYLWGGAAGTSATATGLSAGTYTITVKDGNGCEATTDVVITQPALLGLNSIILLNVSCYSDSNATAQVNVTGGTTPYTYTWSPSGRTTMEVSTLKAGTYTVTVKDGNVCTATTTVVITQPPKITVSMGAPTNNTSCTSPDGSASVTVTGGTGIYTYSWSPSGQTGATASGLAGGTFTCTVTDNNGCKGTASVIITEPFAVTATVTATATPSCYGGNGGAAVVTASGGSAPYTYLWSDLNTQTTATATGLSAGTYSVTVTNASSCATTVQVIIYQPSLLTINTHIWSSIACNGDTALIEGEAAGGTPPYTYAWSGSGNMDSVRYVSAGTYTIETTDNNGCTATSTITVTQPTLLTASTGTTNNNTNCVGPNGSASVTATGGTGAYTYSWSPTGQTTAIATGLGAGTYSCTVKDNNGCNASVTAIVGGTVAPVLTLTSTIAGSYECNGTATATTTGGVAPYTYLWSPGGQTQASISGLCPGTYCCNVTDNGGCSTSTCVDVDSCINTYNQPICIVTIDTATNKSEVIWGRTSSPPAGGYGQYNVYKDSIGGYVLIHTQPLDSLSEFVDPLSTPSLAPQSYKLATVDSCGESALSAPHTSIYLTITAGTNAFILNWTAYVGFTPTEYRIFRGPSMSTLMQIDSVPNTVLTYTDSFPPSGSFYVVEAVSPFGTCVPTHGAYNHSGAVLSGSFSNGFNTLSLGVQSIGSSVSKVNLYPNPSNGIFTLSYFLNNATNVRITIVNELGQIMYDKPEQRNSGSVTEQLNLESLASGIYSLRMQTDNGITVRKLVIMK